MNKTQALQAMRDVLALKRRSPKAATAQLIDDGGGKYVLKPIYQEKG